MRVLLIDDNPDDRTFAARALQQAFGGVEIREVATEDDFRAALAEGGFDVVVTDYQLRWSDGLKVLDALKEKTPDLPVVMFTNTGSEEVCAEGMKRGLADYVLKRHGQYQRLPIAVRGALDRRELQARVDALLARERAAREAAERANRLKEEFLATLSHELRTPLHAVLGWTSLLKQDVLDDADRKNALDVIERNARAQAVLIDDLLDFSRLESGRIDLEIKETDLGPVLLSAISAVQPMAEAKSIRIHPRIDPEAGEALADASRVRQMVLNLLTNAIKFSKDGGEVEVILRRHDSTAAIQVRDQGVGIAPDFLPHVFEPFRQGDSSTTRRVSGMGIGLALTRRIAEAHSGGVVAESAGLGQGATFTITLPMAARRKLPDTAPKRENPPSLKGVRVLAIDDERDSLQYLRHALEHCAATVHVASRAEDGLRIVERERPDVIVCDIAMPGMDGHQFIERLRCADESVRRTPAVALTAFARTEDRERALIAGFDSFVAKPVDGHELIVVVASLARVLQRPQRCEAPGSAKTS